MAAVAKRQGYGVEIIDLPYPAVSVADFQTLLGTYISAGKYYEFGRSVNVGVRQLREYYATWSALCRGTQWVLAGYSQGAMVVSEAAKAFAARDVVYIGLFGDPELSLPEGKGWHPDACRGKNLSEYRIYVPNCQTDDGLLGERNPYEYGELSGKYGLWCASNDYICGSSKNPLRNSGHSNYAAVGINWFGEIVAQRLPKRRLAKRQATLADEMNVVWAILPMEDYYAQVGEELVFDASHSFSVQGSDLRYEWDFGDGWQDGVAQMQRSFAADGLVRLRVTDAYGVQAETSTRVHMGMPTETKLPAPQIELVRDAAGVVYARGVEAPTGAAYLLVRLNGYDLGYVVFNNVLQISDLYLGDDEVLSFAWMDVEYNVGEEYRITASQAQLAKVEWSNLSERGDGGDDPIGPRADRVRDPEPETVRRDVVRTGVIFGVAPIMILFAAAVAVLLERVRHKKDARPQKGERPREGP